MTSSVSISTIRTQKIILSLSLLALIFWLMANTVNLYEYALAGALFEILWLPMIASVFALPIMTIILIIREKGRFHWLAIASLGLNVLMLLMIAALTYLK